MPEGDAKRLLSYSLNLHQAWKNILQELHIDESERVLDVGTGLGLIPLNLAALGATNIWGSDISAEYTLHAQSIIAKAKAAGAIPQQAQVTFEVADVTSLPNASEFFSTVIVREVFSYLKNPNLGAQELFRVCQRGGRIIVEDIDDLLYTTWPEASESFTELFKLVKVLQNDKGGDRNVGRKLTTYLASAGFEIEDVDIITESAHLDVSTIFAEKTFIAQQLMALKPQVKERELMDLHHFDSLFNTWINERVVPGFRMNGRVLVRARKPF